MTDRSAHENPTGSNTNSLPHDVDTGLHSMWRYAHALNHPLYCVDVLTGHILGQTDPNLLCPLPLEVFHFLQELDRPSVHVLDSGLLFCAVPQILSDDKRIAFIGYYLSSTGLRPVDLLIEAAEQGWSHDRFDCWISQQEICHPALLESRLRTIFQNLCRDQDDLLLGFVRVLVSSLDAKDPHTRGHSERVALVARRLGIQLGVPVDQLRNLYLAGLLHDIGKISVDDRILQKAGELTEEEILAVEVHPVVGASILGAMGNLEETVPGVRHHHENFAGGGYPDGLVGEKIPLIARILAVADAFDAMQSDRPYRRGMPLERIENVLRGGAGTQWDPTVITAYFEIREEIHLLAANHSPAALQRHDSDEMYPDLVAIEQIDSRD